MPLRSYSKNGSSSSIADVTYGDDLSLTALAYIAMLGKEQRVLKNIWAEMYVRAGEVDIIAP